MSQGGTSQSSLDQGSLDQGSLNPGSVAELPDRGVVRAAGPDAEGFLQNLLTLDMGRVGEGRAGYGALLTPQGKILFDFIVHRQGSAFLFDLQRDLAGDFIRRLSLYRLRAKVEIEDLSDTHRVFAWGVDRPPDLGAVAAADPRRPELGFRAIFPPGAATPSGYVEASAEDYHAHRIAMGVPEGGRDFTFGEAFPHDAGLDQLGGVDFRKGCYVGQEVVSRMEHRGTARRRILTAASEGDLPAPGTPIEADGRPLGGLGSTAGRRGLALVRVDRVREAMERGVPVTAAGTPLTLAIPGWARFAWPETVAEG